MRISTKADVLVKAFGMETALKMIAASGFDHADLSLFGMAKGLENPFLQDNYGDYAKAVRAMAEDNGISFNQSHAPYNMDMNGYLDGGEAREDVLWRICRAIEVAGIVGAKNIVVHPVHCMDYCDQDPQALLDLNRDFYARLIPTARDAGVNIAIENMWQRHKYSKAIATDVCSSPYELAQYVDACNDLENCFVACLDVGHCLLTGHDPAHAVHILGDRLQTLHVHDVDGKSDLHTCPLTQSVDYYAVMKALRQIGYAGELTLEADCFLTKFRPEFYGEALQFMQKVSRHLCQVFEEKDAEL